MGVSLQQVISAAGYDLSKPEDATWLLSTQREYDELIEEAEELIEENE